MMHRSGSEPVRILLVEDNPGDARLFREILREAGSLPFEIVHVDRLAAAQDALAGEPIDIVLLDLSLPDAHGMETVGRTLAAAPEVPIIVLTGLADETVAVQAVQAGAQDYLVKGRVEGDVLARAIRYAIERKRLERERAELLLREREARATAEAAVRARDEVLRVVSHDIGNSLSAVSIHATVLQRALPQDEAAEPARKRTQAIQNLVTQMHRLRQDLLDMASIEAGKLSIEVREVEVQTVVAEAVDLLGALAADKALHLETQIAEDLPPIQADPERMLQVISNLVGNAIKFTSAGGTVTIRAAAEGNQVCFAVSDTGTGIAAEHLPLLFNRFYRASSARQHGAGLGLAIVKGIVEAQGGRVWVESEVGVGTTFHFTVPATSSTTAV